MAVYYYSLVDSDGVVVKSQFTDNPKTSVPENHRLLLDRPPQAPQALSVGIEIYVVNRIDPVPKNATEIEYAIVRRPQHEVAREIRLLRNKLLSESDWTRLDDVSLSDQKRAVWAEYRQSLRDIPSQNGFPFYLQMPDSPDSV